MEQSKISGGDRRLRPSTLIQDRPERGEEQEILQGESGGISSPSHKKWTQHKMMRKLKVTSGLWQESSFIIITWNPGSNCTCRKKNQFLYWMCCWKNKLKITGTYMKIEICQMHGQVSQDFHWMKSHLTDVHGPGKTHEETNDVKTRQCLARHVEARYVETYVWCIKKESEAQVDYRETKAR